MRRKERTVGDGFWGCCFFRLAIKSSEESEGRSERYSVGCSIADSNSSSEGKGERKMIPYLMATERNTGLGLVDTIQFRVELFLITQERTMEGSIERNRQVAHASSF